jgi:L-ascorbate metabolism protein UlaG (beta-lactamase superfamily)
MSTMNRRRFLNTFFNLLKVSLAASVLPPWVQASLTDSQEPLHYRPLNSMRLRDMAYRKLHHGDGRFLNPLGIDHSGRLLQVLSWKLFHTNAFQADLADQRVIPVTVDWPAVRRNDGLSITYLKHASLLINDAGRRLLIDPVFSDIFWFIRDYTPFAFELNEMPAPDQVLLTHGHYDHLDTAALSQLPRGADVISPLGYAGILDELGMSNRTELDWYQSYSDGDREIILLPCNHWTMRNPVVGPNRALWGSYIIRTASGPTVYVSGDTAFFDGFAQIGQEFDIDLAVINLGAYEPRWFMAQGHINPRETVQAFKQLGAKRLAVIHWGTFQLGDEPVHLPPQHIQAEMRQEGLLDRLVDWKHGETVFL